MRRPLLLAPAALLAVLPVSPPASAGQVCAGYSVTTPVGGNGSNPCFPISPFSHKLSVTQCNGVPPAGVRVCVSFRVDLP